MKIQFSQERNSRVLCRRQSFAILCGILLLLSEALFAQEDQFSFEGRTTSIVFAKGRERTVLSGEASITSDNTFIQAERIEVYGNNFRYAICEGDVQLAETERGYRMRTSSLFFDREAEVVRAEGNTVMEDIDNELIIKGNLLETRNRENITTIQIGVRILGEDITARSEFVRFNRETNVLEMSGLPTVYWKGDEYRALRIFVDLDNDTIDLEGDVQGFITTATEEEATTEDSVAEDNTTTEDAATTGDTATAEDAPATGDAATTGNAAATATGNARLPPERPGYWRRRDYRGRRG